MKNNIINIFLYEDGGDIDPSLSTFEGLSSEFEINLFLALYDGKQDKKYEKICKYLKKAGKIRSFKLKSMEGNSFLGTANSLFLSRHSNSGELLFFLSSRVVPAGLSLPTLANQLDDESLGGIDPLLRAGWPGGEGRCACAGIVCDCQKYLHYLYEGLPASDSLATKTRFFQFGHPGALMIRRDDFIRLGGFDLGIEPLAFYSFCVRLKEARPAGFMVDPAASALLLDKFDSWKFCGTWDSILQRGRLDSGALKIDFPDTVIADGLEYGIDAWLCEGPKDLTLNIDENSAEGLRLAWRRNPNPESLLKFIVALGEGERREAAELCGNLPASLPRVFGYYLAQAEKIANFAKSRSLPDLGRDAAQWLKQSRRFHYGALRTGMKLLQRTGIYNRPLDELPSVFDAWIETTEKFETIEPGPDWPKIAVVMPVYNPDHDFLKQAIESVLGQKYSGWRFCIADDASTDPAIPEILRQYAASDERIVLKIRETNGHISNATNTAIEMVDAPYVAFLDHDDLLAPEALGVVAKCIVNNPGAKYIYSDDDRIDEFNVRRNPVFKPDFDADLFAAGHLSVYEAKLLRGLRGLRVGLEGSQDQDLRIRATECLQRREIAHIPHILYHWRVHADSTASSIVAKPYVIEATKRAWLDSAERKGLNAELIPSEINNIFRTLYKLPQNASCAVILLFDASTPRLSKKLARLLRQMSAYVSLKICAQPLLENSKNFDAGGFDCKRLPYAGKGWVNACNSAFHNLDENNLLFLYAGLEPILDCRPEQLVFHSLRPEIALVGGAIWRRGRLWNGGWYPDVSGYPFPLLRGASCATIPTFVWGHFLMPRHTLGVAWQCFIARKDAIGDGAFLDPSFGELALVDLSLRQENLGRFTLATPWAQWEDNLNPDSEDQSRGEKEYFLAKWKNAVATNGLRNANLREAPGYDWTLILDD